MSAEIVVFAVKLFVSVAEVYMVYMVLGSFYELKCSRWRATVCGVVFMLLLWLCGYLDIVYINLIVTIVCITAISFFLYNGNPLTKIFHIVVYCVILMSSDSFIYYLLNVFSQNTAEQIMQDDAHNVPFAIIAKLLQFVIYCIIIRIGQRKEDRLLPKDFSALIFITLISMVTVFVMCFQDLMQQDTQVVVNIVASFGLLLLNFVMYYLFMRSRKLAITEKEKEFLEQKNQFEIEKFTELEKIQHNVEIIRHDMKNHVAVIAGLIESDQHRAKRYLQEVEEAIAQNSTAGFGGPTAVDAVLYGKAAKARDCDIPLDISLNMDKEIAVNTMDLCSILSNALDNAIEAQCVYEGERSIKVSAQQKDSFLFIRVTNPYDERSLKKDSAGNIMTGKADKKLHGIGLKSIAAVVEKYDGQMDIRTDGGTFALCIILNI